MQTTYKQLLKTFYDVELKSYLWDYDTETDRLDASETVQYDNLDRAIQSWVDIVQYRNQWTHAKLIQYKYYDDGSLDTIELDERKLD